MFTGIIENIGVVKALQKQKNLIALSLDVGKLASGIRLGDSVSINGVCLTAVTKKGRVIVFELIKETIEKTSLKQIKVASKVNLELALKANSRFGGHFVTGHADETGCIQSIDKAPNFVALTVSASPATLKYIVPKGSVALDGISLTVGNVGKKSFSVYLIPYTLKVTNLGQKKVGDLINIETDILAKYARRLCN